MTIALDYSNMMERGAGTPGAALPERALADAAPAFARALEVLDAGVADGTLGFLGLPANAALLAQSTGFAQQTTGRYDDVVVLGIGGSALGPIALRPAIATDRRRS